MSTSDIAQIAILRKKLIQSIILFPLPNVPSTKKAIMKIP